MVWDSSTRDTQFSSVLLEQGTAVPTPAASLSASWQSILGSGDSSVELIPCNDLTK